ncbi:MAG: nitroreductase [Micavibrio sp.]|nr:nitroreductase [Micavibrio sp.]|tara:strand:- start:1107 stop:1784 length:678 start_codon:yes stop_codon:yes gene_type:complete
MKDVYTGKPCAEMLEYLLRRRSAKAVDMIAPGPDKGQMKQMLSAAMRVPDHGKTAPFYFLVFEGEARDRVAAIIAEAYGRNNPDDKPKKAIEAGEKFMQAPTVVAVIYRARKAKHPLWEQIMSVGAACQNLLLAANALGFAAQWLSRWYAYDEHVRAGLGLDGRDVVAGFIHLGTPPKKPEAERDRPDYDVLVTYWDGPSDIKKGDDAYDREKFSLPELGYNIQG